MALSAVCPAQGVQGDGLPRGPGAHLVLGGCMAGQVDQGVQPGGDTGQAQVRASSFAGRSRDGSADGCLQVGQVFG